MEPNQQFFLRWNNYLDHITDAFDSLRNGEDLVDVTLSCEGKKIRAHKVLLSACSSYFREIFKENPCQHPIVIFKNVKYNDLIAIIDFMYQGEVNVAPEQLASFIQTAELLTVRGLSDGDKYKEGTVIAQEIAPLPTPEVAVKPVQITKPVVKTSQSEVRMYKNSSKLQATKRKKSVNARPIVDKKPCIVPAVEETEIIDEIEIYEEPILKIEEPVPETEELVPKTEVQEYIDYFCNENLDENLIENNNLDSCEPSALGNEIDPLLQQSDEDSRPNQEVNEPLKSDTSLEPKQGEPVELEYPCTKCEKCFKHPLSLKQHLTAHLGEATCPFCSKVMNRSYDLKRHIQRWHSLFLEENDDVLT